MDREPAREYRTAAIAVQWNSERCIHAAFCILAQPEVFDPRARPWVVIDAASADAIAEAVALCPTGALHYRRTDGAAQESITDPPTVQTVPDGPLYLRGDLTITDQDGGVLRHDTRIALCRCGESRQKPFCDNTHRITGFRDDGAVGRAP